MSATRTMSSKIIRVYLFGATLLLAFYAVVFTHAIQYTENKNSERRLALIAPHHFALLTTGHEGSLTIDPMLTIFSGFDHLPHAIQRRISKDWQGSTTFHFEDDSEFGLFAKKIDTLSGQKIVYALEDIDVVEWDDTEFAIFQSVIFGAGVFLFVVAAFFIVQMAKRISGPFACLAQQLENNHDDQYAPISIAAEQSEELATLLSSVNLYRARIRTLFLREQTFTRYVSHELRTPMTVIRGGISNLRRLNNEKVNKQSNRIDTAVIEMEQLVHTFLLLAKNEEMDNVHVLISHGFVDDIVSEFAPSIKAMNVDVHYELCSEFNLNAHPLLLSALIKNILKNAINCSIDGQVSLFISPTGIDVIDDGVGLDAKPRGYQGFGIGLNIVRDICDKYQWQFQLKNNPEVGCTASVLFEVQIASQ